MVSALTAQVESKSVAATLSEIDSKTRNAGAVTEASNNEAMFGVIEFQIPHSDSRAGVAIQDGSKSSVAQDLGTDKRQCGRQLSPRHAGGRLPVAVGRLIRL